MWSAIAGAATGALLNAGSSAANAGIQYGTSKALAKYNYELGQRSLRNSPKNYKQGLIDAGINPILAAHTPVGATQGSSGVNPGMSLDEGASKGSSAVNQYKQTESNVELQTKQGDAATEQATAAKKQADAALINAETNAKKAGVEIEGIYSTISLNEAKKATEMTLQGKHMSEEQKNRVASLAQWVASEMNRAELDYWKRHPEQFDDYMEQKLKSEGNMNSARNWKKWTDAANTVLGVADRIMDAIPGKKPSLSIKRSPTKYAPGF